MEAFGFFLGLFFVVLMVWDFIWLLFVKKDQGWLRPTTEKKKWWDTRAFWAIGLFVMLFSLVMAFVAPTAKQALIWIVPAVMFSGFANWQKIVK